MCKNLKDLIDHNQLTVPQLFTIGCGYFQQNQSDTPPTFHPWNASRFFSCDNDFKNIVSSTEDPLQSSSEEKVFDSNDNATQKKAPSARDLKNLKTALKKFFSGTVSLGLIATITYAIYCNLPNNIDGIEV